MHVHGIDDETEARLQTIEQRLGALEQSTFGAPTVPPAPAAAKSSAGRASTRSVTPASARGEFN